MLVRSTVLLCALAITAVARADDVRQLTLGNMHSGSRFEISTSDRVYRAELIDPATGEARLAASQDGVQFSQPQTVFLLGATQGRQADAGGLMLVKMNRLQAGMRIELGLNSLAESDRFVTEPIESLSVE